MCYWNLTLTALPSKQYGFIHILWFLKLDELLIYVPAGNILLYGDTAASPKLTGVQRWVHGSECRRCAFEAAHLLVQLGVHLYQWRSCVPIEKQAGHSHGPFMCFQGLLTSLWRAICVGSLFRGHFYWQWEGIVASHHLIYPVNATVPDHYWRHFLCSINLD